MSDGGNELNRPVLNLNPDEKRFYGQLFSQADTDRLGVITGENAVKFFEKSRIAPNVLGEIWQIADSENRGLLTKPGFCVALRLIGHYQAGRDPTPELGFKPGPLPKFDGVSLPPSSPVSAQAPANALQSQGTGSIRIPPLTPDKIAQYSGLFDRSGQQNGTLAGDSAKAIFERAGLPNEILGRIWSLSDREQKGALDQTEFIIAMHLITSYKSRTMTGVPSVLPPGLYEAASRRGSVPRAPGAQGPGVVSRQFTGPQRTSSPLSRAPFGTPPPQTAQTTGPNWLVTPPEKAKYDTFFDNVDTGKRGYITGDQAVKFFSDSGLSEDNLAQIWDLADVRSEGQLNREEFAVAMYLIRQQRSGAAPLPAFLPAALVPPSMRNQPQSQQTTAPSFDNANNTSQLPKSAADDLFGLDASPPRPAPAQIQQTTGSTAAGRSPFDTDPFAENKPSSPISPQRATFQQQQQTGSNMFKPFQPTSAFGASLAVQNTGGSQGSARGPQQAPPVPQPRQAQPPSAMDDLLGDNDEEQSKKLTEDTTELANMSSQIGNLRNQMQEVQTKRSTHERDVTATNNQKQELQQRLAQFRAQYEQEVKTVKSLEQQLAGSRSETQKLRQELAMIEGSHQDLQTQHQQIAQQLETDQRENASLKERISKLNTEISQLRPQIEKMKSDARQQRGMVAINKKQLATNEGDHEKLQSEAADLTRAAEEQARNVQPTPEPHSSVVSPAPSTSSRNPFFRKSSTQGGVQSPGAFSQQLSSAPSPSAFDALFGPSKQQPRTETPPPTSFHSKEVADAPFGHATSSERPTPIASPAPPHQESSSYNEAPPPPESRQFTPGMLPLRPPPSRGESVASSTRVAPPSHANLGGSETPNLSQANPMERNLASPSEDKGTGGFGSHFGNDGALGLAAGVATGGAAAAALHEGKRAEERPNPTAQDSTSSLPLREGMPGAFPDEAIPVPPMTASTTGGSNGPRQGSSLAKGTSADDFDAAFAGFGGESSSTGPRQQSEDVFSPQPQRPAASGSEDFYPMTHEVEESDSDSEAGFGDDFGSSNAQANGVSIVTSGEHQEHALPATEDSLAQSVPRSGSENGELPPIEAQTSPPSYEQTTSPAAGVGEHGRASSNNFPPEFEGLLPAREDPTQFSHSVPEQSVQSPPATSGQSLFPPSHTPSTSVVTSEAYHDASSRPLSAWTDAQESQPPSNFANKSAFDDDFADFDNLDEAKMGDDRGFDFADNRSDNEFNPTFDSPNPGSTAGFASSQQTPVAKSAQPATSNGFHGFGSSMNNGQPQASSSSSFVPAPSQQASNHDWDAIFSGLDSSAPNVEFGDDAFGGHDGNVNMGANSSNNTEAADAFDVPTPKATSPVMQQQQQQTTREMPKMGRALSTGTEHDDPILKRLTGMGYPRQAALDALEKYDYDINKAVDNLASSR